MISVFLQGGLGNQLFQIACGYAHSLEVEDSFGLQEGQHHLPLQGSRVETYKDTFYSNLLFSNDIEALTPYSEPSFEYCSIPKYKDLLLIGYFQSEKYFKKYRNDLISLFNIDSLSEKYAKEIEENSISLHVRRGDYLNSDGYHPCMSFAYFSDRE